MSKQLKYKESITNSIWEQWKLSDARVVAGRVEISPGGYIQYIKAPKLDEEKGIPEKYRVVITYNTSNLPALYSKSDLMFEIHMTPGKKQENPKYKAITTSAHPNSITSTGLNKCITYVDAKGGKADVFRVVLRNNLNQDVTVSNIEVCPSYAVDERTLIEIEQHIPSVLHGENNDRIFVSSETPTKLIEMDVGTVMSTNLQVHFMVNGVLSEDAQVQLDFKVTDTHLPYSPLEFQLPAGPFLLGIPANIMSLESGHNTFTVHMTISNGTADIKPSKVQCTIDGKGMLSKSSSAAPEIDEVVLIPFKDLLEFGNVDTSFIQIQHIPTPVGVVINIPFIDISEVGVVEDIIDISQTKVADDVWFGPTWENGYDPGYDEVFIYNEDVIKKHSGKLQFKQMSANTITIENTQNWLSGDLYTIELDNTETSKYERLTISAKKRSIVKNDIRFNTDNFKTPEGYIIKGDNIRIITDYETNSKTNLTTDNESYTYVTVGVDESKFNDIKELR